MVQRWNVCAIVFWRVVWYRAGTFLCMRSRPCPSRPGRRFRRGRAGARPSCRGCGRRDVPGRARRGPGRRSRRGRGLWWPSRLCVAVVWLRHADGC